MDSKDRDESKLRRHEETLARRAGEALGQSKPRGAEECPDAGIVAAYAEQSLGPDESAHWEGHFATCARCRQILRVLSASGDAPLAVKEVAQAGQLVAATHAPVEITGRSAERVRPRAVDWRVRWLAPALGVAAVLAVWFAMRPPWRATDRSASGTLIAQAPKEGAPLDQVPEEKGRISNVAPEVDQKAQAAPPANGALEKTAPLNAPAEPPARGRADAAPAFDKVSPNAEEAGSALQSKKQLDRPEIGNENPRKAVPAAPPPAPESAVAPPAPAAPQSKAKAASGAAVAGALQAQSNSNAVESVPSRDELAATVQGQAAPTSGGQARQRASAEMRAVERKEQAFVLVRPLQKDIAQLKAPSGAVVWRAGAAGTIERSSDGGRTWVSQASPSREDWLAGAAVSDTVCWLSGRKGAIARTVDGAHWAPIAPPAQATGTDGSMPDWTSITAVGPQSATITASDGRRFATADGGKTWLPQ